MWSETFIGDVDTAEYITSYTNEDGSVISTAPTSEITSGTTTTTITITDSDSGTDGWTSIPTTTESSDSPNGTPETSPDPTSPATVTVYSPHPTANSGGANGLATGTKAGIGAGVSIGGILVIVRGNTSLPSGCDWEKRRGDWQSKYRTGFH
ncbi:uncharacterized protein BDV17DRAFT_290108 [Aspergillus undulatus]|uniref:uncharacterized protein n=1 Tax=Aspergillus undulatus TaxID=1810928 RepID=UPI003CCE08AE